MKTKTINVNPDKFDKFNVIALEPKKVNRWVVTFPTEFEIESWLLQSTERPTFTNINGEAKIKKIKFVFVDPIGPSIAQKLYNISKSIDKHFHYMLEMLDPTGTQIEKWTISDCKILSINFGKLDYSNPNVMTCEMIIQPTKAELHF